MSLSDNTVNYLLPLSLDGLTSIEVDSFKLNTGAGVLESDANGDVIATYDVDLNSITPTSSELLINGGLRTITNVGVEVPVGKTILYDLQVGPIDTTTAVDKTLSIPVAYNRTSKVRMTESGPSGGLSEAGFDMAYNGTNDRFEILSGSNPVGSAGAAFTTRAVTIDRTTGNCCIGSTINTNNPLSVTSAATQSRQLNVVGATNSSLAVNNASGNLDVCIAGGTGAFSTDAVSGDGVIRQSTASKKLLLQCGTGSAAVCIDNANNVGIAKASGLGTYKLDVLGGIGSQNNSISCYTNTTSNSNGFQILLGGQTTKTGLFGIGQLNNKGCQILANDNICITCSETNGNVGIGVVPHSTNRLNVDGSSRFSGNVDVVGGNQYRVSGVQLNTSHIPENTNLYYTSARATTDARLALSATSTSPLTLTYDNITGLISGSITGSAISKWLDAVSGGIYRNSRIAVNFTDTRSDSVIYSRTDPTNSITAGLYIESPTTSGAQIIQKTSSVQFAQSTSSPGYKIINQTPLSNNNWFGVNTDGTFELYNGNTTNGTEFKFFDGTNLGLPGTGAEIFYGPSTDRTMYFINQESTNSNGFQFWTNDASLDERWRINKNGSLTNKKATTTKIFDINGEARIGNTASPDFYVSFGQPSGTTVGDGCYIQGSSNSVNFVNQQSGDLNLGTNNEVTLKLKQSSTESALEVGSGTTTNKYAYLDLIGDTTYSDHGLRISRDNTGANTTSRIVHRGTGNLEIRAQEAGKIGFYTSNILRMFINQNGRIGINRGDPTYSLDIIGQVNYTSVNGQYMNLDVNTGVRQANGITFGVSCRAQGYFWATTGFLASSDRRIKKNIIDVNDSSALEKLRLIEPKLYNYVDEIERGSEQVYGFIAQQVGEVIPNAIKKERAIVPNIFKKSKLHYNINKNIYEINCVIDESIKKEDIIKLMFLDGEHLETNILEIFNNIISIYDEKLLKYIDQEIFIYGTYVDDFHTLDKNSIFTLNVSATQELDRQIQEQKLRIEDLENENKEQYKLNNIYLNQIKSLEEQLNDLNEKYMRLNSVMFDLVKQLNLKGLGIKI